jgi:hypothetical protein
MPGGGKDARAEASIRRDDLEFLIGLAGKLLAADARNDLKRLEDQLEELKADQERLRSRLTWSDGDGAAMWLSLVALSNQARDETEAAKSAREVMRRIRRHFIEFPWPPDPDD